MSQPRLLVPTTAVREMVADFLASPKGRAKRYCSSFDPSEMVPALAAIPEVIEGAVSFHEASAVIGKFECYKLTAFCNAWTPWMRDRLNKLKYPEAPNGGK